MERLNSCTHCAGFIRLQHMHCPHCGMQTTMGTILKRSRRIAGAVVGSAMAKPLSACYGAPCASEYGESCTPLPETFCDYNQYTDEDGDGFCGPKDCDEQDPSIHVHASEIPDDGIDQDCNGEDLRIACDSSRYEDLDEDGYCGPNDCDETDATRHYGAPEIANDGIDQNCDNED